MEGIYVTGPAARRIRRIARRKCGLALQASDKHVMERPSKKRATVDSLGLSGLCQLLGFDRATPLDVVVGSASERFRTRGITCHVRSSELPAGSFELLVNEGLSHELRLPKDLAVYVESPGLSFVSAAAQFDRMVTTGRMTSLEADLRLLKLGVEDCSTFALDPWQPMSGDHVYELQPAMTAVGLGSYLDELRSVPGIGRARRVAPLVFDGAASQMEALINMGVSLSPAMGGFGLERPLANEVVPLNGLQQLALNHIDHITPDLLWKELRIIIEYLGHEPHEGESAQDEDAGRVQDYQTLGYRVLIVRYKHVHNASSFNKLVRRLSHVMESCGSAGVVSWVEELAADQAFLQNQRTFFKVMLPPVADRAY